MKWFWSLNMLVISCLASGQSIDESIRKAFNDPCFQSASVGFLLVDLSSHDIVFDYQSQLSLPPASLLKILTTTAGLKTLGPDFRFSTEIGYHGAITDGHLDGDLVIRGNGDPTLGSRYQAADGFEDVRRSIVNAVLNSGIRSISGDVIGDSQKLSSLGVGESWPYKDLGNYYGSGAYGLNVHDNLYYIRFHQSPPGLPVEVVRIYPEIPGLQIDNQVIAGPVGSRDEAYIYAAPFQELHLIKGTIPPGSRSFTIKGALPDPAKFLAHHVHKQLLQEGVQIDGEAKSNYDTTSRSFLKIEAITSPTLSEIIGVANRHSVNLYTEAIGKQLEVRLQGTKQDVLLDFFHNENLNLSGCRFTDYAGLAPDNAITGKAMAEVLQYIYDDQELYKIIKASLSVGGISGTMRMMFRNSRASGSIYAKSGLIQGSRNYAGYMESPSGRMYAFSLLSYNAGCSREVLQSKLEHLLESVYLSLL